MMILVTGGSGFIGGHIVDDLIKNGKDVRVFDLYPPLNKNVEWVKGDILNSNDLQLASRDVTEIIHLSAIADVNVALTNPKKCIEVNEIGTLNIVELARGKDIERVILSSTTWVYGKQEKVNEESPIPLPDHIYTKTKIGQEQILYNWNKIYGIPYTILRYDIPYGPRMRSNLVLSIFMRKAQLKEPITIYGDGKQGRCFIYTEDLAKGNVKSLKEEGKNQIINLAGSEFITILDIVNILKEIYPNLETQYLPERPGDFKGVLVDISKAKKLLKWEPKIKYKEGVYKYLESIK